MKTRLLRKLRREANGHFRFIIITEKRLGAWAEVFSFGKLVYYTASGSDDAKKFCRLAINKYILDRIKEIRLKQYYDKRRKKRVLQRGQR